jgi:monothiol glutaredoxin
MILSSLRVHFARGPVLRGTSGLAHNVCLTSSSRTRFFSSHPDFAKQSAEAEPDAELEKKLKSLVVENPVVLFMKGSPNSPQCGFSRQVAMVLAQNSVENYTYVDILKSNEVRSGMKKFSDWPTFPQLYVDGEFVGGCDIVSEMHRNGELTKVLEKYAEKKEN